ncbi:zinc-binding dehydrogenase [Halomonas salipaludis]|uniref:Uncharacterized protein n=1 Tax=Halomonas salipaludis TaxID=2032625 RepID=A0A2A2F1N6_9GAMM|nr:zinc-binding dehydrogenase [Halomonas salipaludis]PAU78545.1 hypothetical protein CK498_07555 [Halomonas salipaludis]
MKSRYYPFAMSILSSSDVHSPKRLDALPLKRKSLALHWELMFTSAIFQTTDMIRQHDLLERVAALIDEGALQTTMTERFGALDVNNMRRAHAQHRFGRSARQLHRRKTAGRIASRLTARSATTSQVSHHAA